jgi:hypothetical protein
MRIGAWHLSKASEMQFDLHIRYRLIDQPGTSIDKQ